LIFQILQNQSECSYGTNNIKYSIEFIFRIVLTRTIDHHPPADRKLESKKKIDNEHKSTEKLRSC